MIHANATPRVYVACLSSYNAGTLHGAWVDAIDADELREGIEEMLADSPADDAEEWAIHDSEDWGEYPVREHEDIDELTEIGRLIEEHGDAFAAYAANVGGDATENDFQDAYCGEWDSEREYAENTMGDLYNIPDHLVYYIDYDAVARDWFCSDYYSIEGGAGVFVFRNY
jgi:antirestriction protein